MQVFRSNFIDDHSDLATAITLTDDWVQHNLHVNHHPGVAVGIVSEGELIWGKGYGYADIESKTPVTLDTRFRIASISKTFTGTAIMQLVQAGKLQLDDPIEKYLAWFDLHYGDAPPITIRQCLTHTSGLPRDSASPIWQEDEFDTWEQIIETTKKRKPLLPPVKDFAYSNLAYALLGGVILEVTGQTWNEYVQQHILDPLAMTNTLTAARGGEDNIATGYLRPDNFHARQAIPIIDSRGFDSAAGIVSSVSDLAKYAKFHMSTDNHALLSAYSLREIHRPHWTFTDFSGGYGLGVRVTRIGDWALTGHTGGYKGFLTYFGVSREYQAGFIVLTNALDSEPLNYTRKIVELILPELAKIRRKTNTANPAWDMYVGRYQSQWRDFNVVIRDNTLQAVSVAYPTEPPAKLEPTDEPHTFVVDVMGNPGQIVRFVMDANNQVTRMYTGNEYADRVK